ncbi:hypothetical protein, partial [Stutzerimonas sp.]|uniref:hypothetical protein n=1 Tax=Stutzerimonas sp. TaxID=2901166 RepID=UPI0035ADDC8E
TNIGALSLCIHIILLIIICVTHATQSIIANTKTKKQQPEHYFSYNPKSQTLQRCKNSILSISHSGLWFVGQERTMLPDPSRQPAGSST